ncbi:MAG: methyltransferase domain-containing protein, partial [Candidatus Methanomethyliaceae archaeon]
MADSERKEIVRVFDAIAEEFSHSRRRIWRSLEDAGPFEGKLILDLGAGSGRNTKFLVEKGAALVVAADISSEMLSVLVHNLDADLKKFVEAVRCDALYLPFIESAFDKVIFVA